MYTTKLRIGVVVGMLLLGALPLFGFAATLNLVTDRTRFAIGDEFIVDIKIDSESVGINAAQATLLYSKDILQATSTDKTKSVFDFWLQDPAIDNTTGKISFIGGSAGSISGVSGKTLQVLRITFKVVGTGDAHLSFTDGAVTASDGNGTNVLTRMNGLDITSITTQAASRIPAPVIIPPVTIIKRVAVPSGKLSTKPIISVPLYPNQDAWYNIVSKFLAQWDLPKDVTDVATALNKEPLFDPTKSEGLFDNKTFPEITDGGWYLHVRFKNNMGWGPTSHYEIGIDTFPPLIFNVGVKEGLDTSVITPTLLYQTNDQPSGINYYVITVDGKVVTSTPATTFTLPTLDTGNHSISVEANDFAGNKTATRINVHIQEHAFLVIGGFSITQFWFFVDILIVLILGFLVGWFSYRSWRKQLGRKVLIAQRDVVNSFAVIGKDVETAIALYKEDNLSETGMSEVKFILNKIKTGIKKMQKYVVENIEEISE